VAHNRAGKPVVIIGSTSSFSIKIHDSHPPFSKGIQEVYSMWITHVETFICSEDLSWKRS
jgi:hypothetical protein